MVNFKVGKMYKFDEGASVGSFVENYWEQYGITDKTFVPETIDLDGDAHAMVNGRDRCIVVANRRTYEVKSKKFKVGKRYRYIGTKPMSSLVEYWERNNITDKTFVVEDVNKCNDALVMVDGNPTVVCKLVQRSLVEVVSNKKPTKFVVGNKYVVRNHEMVNGYHLNEYWTENEITDHTFEVVYVDNKGDAYCMVENGIIKCVVLKKDIKAWDVREV